MSKTNKICNSASKVLKAWGLLLMSDSIQDTPERDLQALGEPP